MNFSKRACSLLAILLCCAMSIFAQTGQKISMDIAKSKLETILMEINKVSQYEVQFMKNDVGDIVAGPIRVKDVTINELMDKCLANTQLTYTVNNMSVVVKKKAQEPAKKIAVKGHVTEQGNDEVPLIGAYVLVKGTTMVLQLMLTVTIRWQMSLLMQYFSSHLWDTKQKRCL